MSCSAARAVATVKICDRSNSTARDVARVRYIFATEVNILNMIHKNSIGYPVHHIAEIRSARFGAQALLAPEARFPPCLEILRRDGSRHGRAPLQHAARWSRAFAAVVNDVPQAVSVSVAALSP